MIKVVALCKTFRGEEFVEAMIESIYNEVDRIVFIHSNISWTGEKVNTVKPVVEKWKDNSDTLSKIYNIDYDCADQVQQYNYGLEYIKNNFDSQYIMFIDTDEIWNDGDINKCKKFIVDTGLLPAYTINMRTYIKNPFYRLTNIEPCTPTVFIKSTCSNVLGVRGNGVTPRVNIPNIFMHHFTYVRKSEDDVIDKIYSSTKSDGLTTIDINRWKREKWDLLPNPTITDLHTSKGFEHYWHGVEEIPFEILPKVFRLRNHSIMERVVVGNKLFLNRFMDFKRMMYYKNLPQGELQGEDEKLLFDLSVMSKGPIIEIGTFKGRSAALMAYSAEKVITLDIFEDINLIKDDRNKVFYSEFYNKYPHTFKEISDNLKKYHNIQVLQDVSSSLVYRSDFFGGAFIDGDHSYEGCKRDLENILPNIIIGGYIALHDSLRSEEEPFKEVWKLVEELRKDKRFEFVYSGGTTTIWRKL